MIVDIAFTQHSGKKRRTQQDALWDGQSCFQSADQAVTGNSLIKEDLMLAVADGVSVSPAPSSASRFVVESLAKSYASQLNLDVRLIRQVHGLFCDRHARSRTYARRRLSLLPRLKMGCV